MNNKEKQFDISKNNNHPNKMQSEQTSEYAETIKQIIKDTKDVAQGKGEYATYEEIFGEDKKK